MTAGAPVFRTAIPAAAVAPVESPRVTLRDLSGVGVILIQGDVGTALATRWPALPHAPGQVSEVGDALLCRLTPSELYLLSTSPSAPLPPADELNAELSDAGCFAHATDYRHGSAVLRLSGSDAVGTMRKICGLDFSDSAFPNLAVRQTSAAKIKTLIVRSDEREGEGGGHRYYLVVNRPFGEYMWHTVRDAALEFLEKEQT